VTDLNTFSLCVFCPPLKLFFTCGANYFSNVIYSHIWCDYRGLASNNLRGDSFLLGAEPYEVGLGRIESLRSSTDTKAAFLLRLRSQLTYMGWRCRLPVIHVVIQTSLFCNLRTYAAALRRNSVQCCKWWAADENLHVEHCIYT
jgi:hypothetical protein